MLKQRISFFLFEIYLNLNSNLIFFLFPDQPTVLESNQVPKPSTWYYVELQYAKNSNGSILLFRGYRYDRQKLFPDAVISWKCSERDCPAMVFTLGENCLKIKSHAHNHACLGNKAMVFSKKVSQLAPQYQNVQPALQAPCKLAVSLKIVVLE